MHGDLKPANILVFQEGARYVVKISDFGSSSSWKDSNARILMPASRPWHAPEWHHRPVPISDAVKMDIYSFGLLCIWLFLQGDHILSLTSSVPKQMALAFEQWSIQDIELYKEDNSITEKMIPHLRIPDSSDPRILESLHRVFRETLQHNELERISDFTEVVESLQLDSIPTIKGLKGSYLLNQSFGPSLTRYRLQLRTHLYLSRYLMQI